MNVQNEYLECRCYSPDHTVRFVFDDDPEYPELYAYVLLSQESLFKRIWKALKYVFGFSCRYGHFDEFILRREDCDRLISLLERFSESFDRKKR